MTIAHHRDEAILAVVAASDAIASMANYVNEGPTLPEWPFGEAEPMAKLTEALIRTAEIELEAYCSAGFADEDEQIGQLIAACRKFIKDWTS
jgi:hypothetical protein